MAKKPVIVLDEINLDISNIEGRIYLSANALRKWINLVGDEYGFSEKKISRIWNLFDKNRFVIISTYDFSVYSEQHRDYKKIKNYLKNKRLI